MDELLPGFEQSFFAGLPESLTWDQFFDPAAALMEKCREIATQHPRAGSVSRRIAYIAKLCQRRCTNPNQWHMSHQLLCDAKCWMHFFHGGSIEEHIAVAGGIRAACAADILSVNMERRVLANGDGWLSRVERKAIDHRGRILGVYSLAITVARMTATADAVSRGVAWYIPCERWGRREDLEQEAMNAYCLKPFLKLFQAAA